MLSGFNRLRYESLPTDLILRFYEQFWGVPLPQEHISLKESVHDPNDQENDKEKGGEDDKENEGENDAESEGENGGDLLPPMPPPIIDADWARLLIRAEYLGIYKWIEYVYAVGKVYRPSAIVVTGQPGIGPYSVINMRSFFFNTLLCIGKSFWAYYVLRRRLGGKSISLWYQDPAYGLSLILLNHYPGF